MLTPLSSLLTLGLTNCTVSLTPPESNQATNSYVRDVKSSQIYIFQKRNALLNIIIYVHLVTLLLNQIEVLVLWSRRLFLLFVSVFWECTYLAVSFACGMMERGNALVMKSSLMIQSVFVTANILTISYGRLSQYSRWVCSPIH